MQCVHHFRHVLLMSFYLVISVVVQPLDGHVLQNNSDGEPRYQASVSFFFLFFRSYASLLSASPAHKGLRRVRACVRVSLSYSIFFSKKKGGSFYFHLSIFNLVSFLPHARAPFFSQVRV